MEVAAEMLSSRAVSNLRTRTYSSGPERLSYGAVSQLRGSPCRDDYLLNRSERIETTRVIKLLVVLKHGAETILKTMPVLQPQSCTGLNTGVFKSH